MRNSNVSFSAFRVNGGLHRSIERGCQEEKIKEDGPPQFACWTLHKPYNRAAPEWLVSEDGPAERHLDKNEAISQAHQLWLTPNRACTRSKAFFALRRFVVWTKVVNKPITLETQWIFFFFVPVRHLSYAGKCIIFSALASVCIMTGPARVVRVCASVCWYLCVLLGQTIEIVKSAALLWLHWKGITFDVEVCTPKFNMR